MSAVIPVDHTSNIFIKYFLNIQVLDYLDFLGAFIFLEYASLRSNPGYVTFVVEKRPWTHCLEIWFMSFHQDSRQEELK